jgi:hypothetical protein
MPRLSLPERLCLDALMVALFVAALAFRATGRAPHEWIGVGFTALLGLHIAVNLGWYKILFRGRYNAWRTVNTVTNMALLTSMLVLCVTGVMNSRHIFGFSRYFNGESLRRIHSLTAYWNLVFIGVHTGLHWKMVMGAFRKLAWSGRASANGAALYALRAATLLVMSMGVWASYDRDMGAKLFQGFAFDFWDPGRPLILFFAGNLAIVGIYAIVAHYTFKLVKGRGQI